MTCGWLSGKISQMSGDISQMYTCVLTSTLVTGPPSVLRPYLEQTPPSCCWKLTFKSSSGFSQQKLDKQWHLLIGFISRSMLSVRGRPLLVVDFLTLIINLEIRSEVNGPETADSEPESYPNSQVMSQTLPSKTPLTWTTLMITFNFTWALASLIWPNANRIFCINSNSIIL